MARPGKRFRRHVARARKELDRHVLAGAGPLPSAARKLRRFLLAPDYEHLRQEIDELLDEPSTFPDLAALDSYWSGLTSEPPERWYT